MKQKQKPAARVVPKYKLWQFIKYDYGAAAIGQFNGVRIKGEGLIFRIEYSPFDHKTGVTYNIRRYKGDLGIRIRDFEVVRAFRRPKDVNKIKGWI